MYILLDTNYLLWAVDQPARFSAGIREALESPENVILFSAVSIWEIAIKAALRRDDFNAKPDEVAQAAQDAGFTPLSVSVGDAVSIMNLPLHHRDPFDRLLVAQALNQPARLLTSDSKLARYSELVWLQPA